MSATQRVRDSIRPGWMSIGLGHTRNKAHAERLHALRRAYERYGWELTEEEINAATKAIIGSKGSKAKFIGRQSNVRSLYLVLVRETWVPVIYDKKRHVIVTFLPPECREVVVPAV